MERVKKVVYTAEYRVEAVKLVMEQGLGVSEVARRLGMPMQTLASWVARVKEERSVKSPGSSAVGELEVENVRLKKALAVAQMERDILKKAAAYGSTMLTTGFAKESVQGTRKRKGDATLLCLVGHAQTLPKGGGVFHACQSTVLSTLILN